MSVVALCVLLDCALGISHVSSFSGVKKYVTHTQEHVEFICGADAGAVHEQYCSTANHRSTLVLVAVPRYPTNTPQTPNNEHMRCAHLVPRKQHQPLAHPADGHQILFAHTQQLSSAPP